MKKLLLCVSTALLAMLAGCSEGIGGGGDFLTNLSGNNKIYYTSTDGEKIFPMVVSGEVDAVLLSNTYKNGRGCMTFDEDVTKICGLFNGEDRLVSVELPNSLTEIGRRSFNECTNLAEITIPDSVTSIREYAFYECTSLTSVYCKAVTPPAGGPDMFYHNASGRKIYVPTESVDAYKTANYWSDYKSYIYGYDF